MAIIRKPETLSRAFNPIIFRVSDNTLQLQLQYPNDQNKIVTLTGVQIDDILNLDVSGVIKYLFKDLREALQTNISSNWAWIDYNLHVDYRVMGELFTALNAVSQPGRTGTIPVVQSMREQKNNVYTIPKYDGYPVGVCIAHNPSYDSSDGVIILYGRLSDLETGQGIANAVVQFTSPDGNTIYGMTVTNNNGEYLYNWVISPLQYPNNLRFVFVAPNYNTVDYNSNLPSYDYSVENGVNITVASQYIGATIHISGSVTYTDESVVGGAVLVLDGNDETHQLLNIPITNNSYSYNWRVSEAEYNSYTNGLIFRPYSYNYMGDDSSINIQYQAAIINGINVDISFYKASVTVNPTYLNFDEDVSTKTINVTTNPSNLPIVDLYTLQDWISISEQNGVISVTVTQATENRFGSITFTAGGKKTTVNINQYYTADYIITTPNKISIPYDSTTPFTITVDSSSTWGRGTLPTQWITADISTGHAGVSIVTLTPTINTGTSSRGTLLTFSNTDGVASSVSIIQGSAGKLLITGKISDLETGIGIPNAVVNIYASPMGLLVTKYADSQGNYSYEWIVDETTYNQNNLLIVSSSLSGYIYNSTSYALTPFANISNNPANINVQLEKIENDYININGRSSFIISIDGNSNNYPIDIESNSSWNVTYTTSDNPSESSLAPPWINGIPNNGIGNESFVINISQNNSAFRTCNIIFRSTSGYQAQIRVSQNYISSTDVYLLMNLVARNGTMPSNSNGLMEVYNSPISSDITAIIPDTTGPGQPPNYNVRIPLRNLTLRQWNNRLTTFIFTVTTISGSNQGGGGSFTVNATYQQLIDALSTPAGGFYIGTVYLD